MRYEVCRMCDELAWVTTDGVERLGCMALHENYGWRVDRREALGVREPSTTDIEHLEGYLAADRCHEVGVCGLVEKLREL